jgi:hypothetical protein
MEMTKSGVLKIAWKYSDQKETKIIRKEHLHSANNSTFQGSCHLPAAGRKCVSRLQALTDFCVTRQAPLHKNNKIN